MPQSERAKRLALPSRETVKKHVAAIHTNGALSLLERKMGNIILLNAYDSLLTARTHKIPVKLLCAMMGWDESHNTDRLKDALRALATTPIEFNLMEDGKESWQITTMLSFGKIKDGICTYRYDEALAEKLYDPEVYATINIGVQRQFDSGYALTLYENCVRYKAIGTTGVWSIERFRALMGATASMYSEFKYLKRDVIVKPIDQINRVSDIHLTFEPQKSGRNVTGVKFLIKESEQQTLLSPAATDEYAEIRKNLTYQRLMEHGIGDRLALLWVMQEEDRVKAVIDYVEERDKKRQIKGSTAGYIRKLIEDKAEVGKSTYEEKKQEVVQTELQVRQQAELEKQQKLERDKQERETVWLDFMSWPESERTAFVEQKLASIGMAMQAYRTRGIESPIVKGNLIGHLRERLRGQERDGSNLQ